MFLLIESVRSALNSIRAHRMRSFLTSLGIIIGVASVITVISLIQGLSKSVTKQFEGLGGNSLTITAHNSFKDAMRGKMNELRFEDIDFLRSHVDEISDISPLLFINAPTVRFGSTETSGRVIATTPTYQDAQQRFATMGRFLSDSDEVSARRVAVIGPKLIETLHLPDNPIGQYISFSNEWFKIIGVMEKRGELFGMSQDDYVIIPFRTGRSIIGNNQRLRNMQLTVSLHDISKLEEVKPRIRSVMRASHRLDPDVPDDFDMESSDQLSKSLDNITATVTLVMGGIVSIALLVGGIGIMNIMLVSVTERTREIGICKAIGARSRDIMMQFLIEAVTLSVLGGLIGLILGYGLGFGISKMIPDFPDAVVPWWAVVLSFVFSAGVGIVFGVMPASKAAKLDPIDALRYE
ncbi:ABC transporter permease [Undibacterium cyanobacteriorum]|uniref:ABC transporter permease n=1 Tax=Undibacterium cyanobacteriorum TaxID=3073561 RepID=A0ABY9RJB1_9BURK|nr:ABC transporter permease [Undibacterium sp. 20NA77.5]WMW81287.1 ABC transporter permease [Undibacterium sp. 20NA77.5]